MGPPEFALFPTALPAFEISGHFFQTQPLDPAGDQPPDVQLKLTKSRGLDADPLQPRLLHVPVLPSSPLERYPALACLRFWRWITGIQERRWFSDRFTGFGGCFSEQVSVELPGWIFSEQ